VIVAGRQLDSQLRDPLARLATAAGFPILADPTSQLRCGPHDRSHVVASYDLLLRDEGFARSVAPDLVLRFGEMPTSKPLRAWIAGSGADELIVDPKGGWNEPSNKAAAILRADPAALATGWAERLDSEERHEPTPWLDAEAVAQAALSEAFETGTGLTEPALHRTLGACHQDGDLVYTSSSMPIRDQEAFLAPSTADVLFLSNRGANGIDGLISSGIGAARGTGRPTTIVTGDLGLLHDLGGLAALREASTPVRIVVIDNAGGGIFHFLPQEGALPGDEFEALLGTPRGVDAAKAADLFGLSHRRLESLGELPEALAAGTGLLEVRTDRRTNVETHRALTAQVQQALPS
jgi:2-succinyl-5-enolpyruvyl-6-hydroxy-3-cyclohexene-1-carboxylate synthase